MKTSLLISQSQIQTWIIISSAQMHLEAGRIQQLIFLELNTMHLIRQTSQLEEAARYAGISGQMIQQGTMQAQLLIVLQLSIQPLHKSH